MKKFIYTFVLLFFALINISFAQISGPIFPGPGGVAGLLPPYSNTRSLNFVAASSQYLSATGKTSVNRQKFTVSFWVKFSSVGVPQYFWQAGDATGSNFFSIDISSTNHLEIQGRTANSLILNKATTDSYTDTSAWHQITVAVDTTQATAANRVRLYYDGTEITSWGTNTIPAQNTSLAINYAATWYIGSQGSGVIQFTLNGLLDEFYYIDGQQLTPSSFITGLPGVPQRYTGTYTGVFDIYLNFENNASTTTLGADNSGEGNNWTLNAMTTANSSTDVPM